LEHESIHVALRHQALEEVVVEKIVCASNVNRCTLFCPAGARQGR
jgi:hypothetical protein